MQHSYVVEDENFPRAIKILEKNGFKRIVRMPRLCLYDCEAEKNGEKVYIEVRVRSKDKRPYFVFNRSKLERLKTLKTSTGRPVFILLMWHTRHILCDIDSFPPHDLIPFRVSLFGKGIPAVRFPVEGEMTADEINEAIELRRKNWTIEDIAIKLKRTEVTIRKHIPSSLRPSIKRTAGGFDRCPRCGYEVPKGKKVVTRIWMSQELNKDWENLAKDYETKEMAFNEVLRKARLYDKEHERSRLAIEAPTKP